MDDKRELYSKKQYLLSIEQKTSIRELRYEFHWKNPFNTINIDILMTNVVLAESITGKFYPAEEDEARKEGLLKDLSDLLCVIKEDARSLGESEGLNILKEKIKALEIFAAEHKKEKPQ